jgi:uncharacterized protein (DUF1684 family)
VRPDPERLREDVEAWRARRYALLRREVGWLTLIGLDWLRPGVNRVGSDPSNDVVIPTGPARAGTLTVTDAGVAADGAFLHDGASVDRLVLATDRDGEPTMLELGALRMCVINRGGRLALRSWDTASERPQTFTGLDHWPPNPDWLLQARFEPTSGRSVTVPDVTGMIEEEASPGELAFEVDGVVHRLQALEGGDAGELWLIFGDATNGNQTYGGGRYLYTDAPDADGRVTVDFNRAYNPPCVFTPYATCPLPWPENRLPIRVEAGERAFSAEH